MRALKRLWDRASEFRRVARGDRRLREEMEEHTALDAEEENSRGDDARRGAPDRQC